MRHQLTPLSFSRWCPADTDHSCGIHHQSPIDLSRTKAIVGHPDFNQCIDVHWMAYFDSSCDFEILQDLNAFSIERHALKIAQPLEEFEPQKFRLACKNENGRRWGKIDFSKGFSHWWHLSHIDFHVPSEHTQHGRRYSGEMQMYHWYSVNATVAGINNEMASVTIFLDAHNDTADYDYLNKLICQWREAEDTSRDQCGLPSVSVEFPGCFFHRRGHDANETPEGEPNTQRLHQRHRERRLAAKPKSMTAHDVIVGNTMSNSEERTIVLDDEDLEPIDDFDWDSFIASHYSDRSNIDGSHHRKLINFDHVGPWSNYFGMLDVRTEYYFRYSGSTTIPPCYGKWYSGNNRRQTNHWRVMKDPIRVSQRQILEMHRLLRERIAPIEDPVNACKPDTAAKVEEEDPAKVSVARPLQSTSQVHFKVFCECENWGSKFVEDREWCRRDKLERFFDHPYNFKTVGY
uniref:carbonic anhydrase n=1 Tax=Entomoneis paludosa TaxID=265537 RepID=A0A7S2YLZ8_9STRA|mmetsp:Transcript_38621/g.80250  ORF Transcript_38621/g.80250 Transcript_38621/m.80250 type:complete len:460 (+) Transcript_38621:924-2303(+)